MNFPEKIKNNPSHQNVCKFLTEKAERLNPLIYRGYIVWDNITKKGFIVSSPLYKSLYKYCVSRHISSFSQLRIDFLHCVFFNFHPKTSKEKFVLYFPFLEKWFSFISKIVEEKCKDLNLILSEYSNHKIEDLNTVLKNIPSKYIIYETKRREFESVEAYLVFISSNPNLKKLSKIFF